MPKKVKRGAVDRKAAVFMRVYIAALLLFSIWIVLDQFVIPHDYMEMQQAVFVEWTATIEPSPTPEPAAPTPEAASTVAASPTPTASPTLTPSPTPAPTFGLSKDCYVNGGVRIEIAKESIEVDGGWVTVTTADIRLDSVSRLKAAFAHDVFSTRTSKTSTMAREHNAIFAVNGDYCGARDYGYVVRNGVLYRDKVDRGAPLGCIWPDGRMTVVENQQTADINEMVEQGVWQVFSFGPILIDNGEIYQNKTFWTDHYDYHNPRTAIGMIEPNHYLLLVADGRSKYGIGMTIGEMAEYMLNKGVTAAYNLDGGGSTTMYFNGKVINHPCGARDVIKERSVTDILYIEGETD